MRRSAFTLIELMIVVAIIGLLAAIIIPAVTDSKQKAAKKEKLTPVEFNDYMIEQSHFKKVAEFRGYDIYTFFANGDRHSVAIPVTNSVYDLERK